MDELQLMAAFVKGKRVLEIGTGLGVSTRAMLATCAYLTSVDTDPWVKEAVVPGLGEDFRDKFFFYDALPPLGGEGYDVVFVDGHHSEEAVKADVEYAMESMNLGGLLLIHDLHLAEVASGVRRAGQVPFVLRTPMMLGMVVL